MTTATKFELHYFLSNDIHSIDAILRNKCEAELLAIVYEAISIMGLDVTIEAEALQEGGSKRIMEDAWR